MKIFNKAKGQNKEKIRMNYLPIYLGFISIFLTLSLLTLTTYAWFTGSAITKGNIVNSGNLFIDLLADDAYLDEIGYPVEKRSKLKTYSRKVNDITEDYYVITNSEIPIITINNVEPGQVYPVEFSVVNIGGLAVKYTAAFNIQEDDKGNPLSFTGLETLEQDKDLFSNKEYEHYKKILESKQLDSEGNDIGGHLEDILDVYVGKSEEDIKPENYIGKLSEILNGKFGAYTGYSLPKKELLDENENIVSRNVNIVDDEGNVLRTENSITELGTLNYLIKMPEDATSIYEYASLSFSLGATATQAEYEKDGLNSMIYDSFDRPEDHNDPNRCIITKAPKFYSGFEMGSSVVITSPEEDLGTCNQGLLYFYILETPYKVDDNYYPPSPNGNMENWYTYDQLSDGGEYNNKNKTTSGFYYTAFCCAYDPTNPNSIPSSIVRLGDKFVWNSL